MAERTKSTGGTGRVFLGRGRHPRARAWGLGVACALVLLGGCQGTPEDDPNAPLVWVAMDTSMGEIVVELDRAHAPISVDNFLRYVDEQAYDNTIFHRVMRDFVIQGGGHTVDLAELPGHEPIANEWLSGLKNTRGTIAMARETEPDSATRQWYINVTDNPRLDTPREVTGNAGYAVFGRVVEGMDVVDAIRMVEVHTATGPDGVPMQNVPVDPVVVRSVKRVRQPGE